MRTRHKDHLNNTWLDEQTDTADMQAGDMEASHTHDK